jgi:hypothetical protein
MKKALSFFILSILFMFTINAQELISNSGGFYSNSNGSLAWSVGEAVISTVSDGTNTLTQGFHQSRYEITAIGENDITDVNIQVFPNPVADYINIEIESSDLSNFSFTLHDNLGKILCKENVVNTNSKVDMSIYPAANYFITVYQNGISVKAIQIIKHF